MTGFSGHEKNVIISPAYYIVGSKNQNYRTRGIICVLRLYFPLFWLQLQEHQYFQDFETLQKVKLKR